MNSGDIFKTISHGFVEVVQYKHFKSVKVVFLNTGFECVVRADHLRAGKVKDLMNPTVANFGFIGGSKYSTLNRKKAYSVWNSMINRCYSPYELNKHITYVDVTVCSEWANFQNFASWFDDNYPKDGGKYDLDKDILSGESKIYSPDTCCFVSHADNMLEAMKYKMSDAVFLSPNGNVVTVGNIRKFARDNNLKANCLSMVKSGKRRHHKGWTLISTEKTNER